MQVKIYFWIPGIWTSLLTNRQELKIGIRKETLLTREEKSCQKKKKKNKRRKEYEEG